jgi:TetR/AcrR family transcriptional regulator
MTATWAHMESGGSAVRTRILRAATDVFSDKGFAGASISDISSAARVTKPMLYYYFGDKAGLFDAVIEQVHGRLKTSLDARDQRVGAIDRLSEIAELVFQATREDPTVSRLQYAAFFGISTGAAKETLVSSASLVFQSILDAVQSGVRTGELSGDPNDLARLVDGTINARVLAFLSGQENALATGEGRRLVKLLVQGIGQSSAFGTIDA